MDPPPEYGQSHVPEVPAVTVPEGLSSRPDSDRPPWPPHWTATLARAAHGQELLEERRRAANEAGAASAALRATLDSEAFSELPAEDRANLLQELIQQCQGGGVP